MDIWFNQEEEENEDREDKEDKESEEKTTSIIINLSDSSKSDNFDDDNFQPEMVEIVNIDYNVSSNWKNNIENLQQETSTKLMTSFNHNFSPTSMTSSSIIKRSYPNESIINLLNCATSTLNCTNLPANVSIPWSNNSNDDDDQELLFINNSSEHVLRIETTLSSSSSSSLSSSLFGWENILNQSNLHASTFVNNSSSNIFTTQNITFSSTISSPTSSTSSSYLGLISQIHHPLLALFLGLLCLMVVFGNILIMVAIRRERYLHTVTNLFVASLAVADCLVGLVVMPSSVVHEVMNKLWIFGQDWCDLWHSFDVLASTASILNLCIISLDRYWAITDPISYPARMTPRKAKLLIAILWTCSSIISFPAIIWWRAVSPPSPPLRCDFTEDASYLVTSSIISFYGPLMIMLFVYFRIYRAAVQQTKSFRTGLKSIPTNDGKENKVVLRIHRGGGGATSAYQHHHQHHQTGTGNRSEGQPLKGKVQGQISFEDSNEYNENGLDIKVNSVRHRNMKAFSISRKVAKLAKERKAAKTLGIVMGVFILCWLPFFIANVVKALCGDECLINPDFVYSLVTWLGWLNSGMNPFIYACWSKDFRRAFKKILCSCCHRSTNLQKTRQQPIAARNSYHSANINYHETRINLTNNNIQCKQEDNESS